MQAIVLKAQAQAAEQKTHQASDKKAVVSPMAKGLPVINFTEGTGHEFRASYKVFEELGTGSFATVHRVTQRSTGHQYAAKIIRIKQITPQQLAKLDREIRICRKLHHHNIVELHAAFRDSHHQYLVFDLISGGELFYEIVNRKKYSELDAADCMYFILYALEYCHEKHILHRDIKPENLLLTSLKPDGVIKLADFGLSVEIEPTDGPKYYGYSGSLSYMAPEIISEEAYSFPADMWSSGIVLFVLLAGKFPFYDRNELKLGKLIQAGQVQFPSPDWDGLSEESKNLVLKLLTVNQAKRFTATQALRHPFIANRHTVASLAHRESTVEHLKAFNAKRKLKAAIDVAMLAAKMKAPASVVKDDQEIADYPASFVTLSSPSELTTPQQRQHILKMTQRLLAAGDLKKAEEVSALTVPHMTSFSDDGGNEVDQGQHIVQRETSRSGKVTKTIIRNPYIHILGPNAAVIAYKKITTYQAEGSKRQEVEECAETRVWQRLSNGQWVNLHVHRSRE